MLMLKIKTKDGKELFISEGLLKVIKSLDLIPEELSATSINAIGLLNARLKIAEDWNDKILESRNKFMRF